MTETAPLTEITNFKKIANIYFIVLDLNNLKLVE